MPFFLIIFIFCALPLYSVEKIIVASPKIKPEQEFGYLSNPIVNFIKERLNGENSKANRDLTMLESSFDFQWGKAVFNLSLSDFSTKKLIFHRNYEATFEDFWKTLDEALEDVKIALRVEDEKKDLKGFNSKASEPSLFREKNFKEEKPSFFFKNQSYNIFIKVNS